MPTLHISKMLPKLEKGRKTLQMKQRVPETYRRTPPRLHPNLQHHSARASWDLSGENLKVCDFGGEIMWNLLVGLTGLNLERKTSLKSCWGYTNTTKYHIHFCIALPPIVGDLTWTCFPGIPDNQFPLASCRLAIALASLACLLKSEIGNNICCSRPESLRAIPS